DRDATRQKNTERLAGQATKTDRDRVGREAVTTPACCYCRAEHGADRPVHVPDEQLETDRAAIGQGTLRQLDQRVVQSQIQVVGLVSCLAPGRAWRELGDMQQRRQV